MVSRRDVRSIEAEVGRTFEQMIPFNRVLGLKIDSLDPKMPRLRFDMRPELVGNPVRQILHGGVISATLDVVGGLAIALASLAKKPKRRRRGIFRISVPSTCASTICGPGAAIFSLPPAASPGSAVAWRWPIWSSLTTPRIKSRPARRPTSSAKRSARRVAPGASRLGASRN
jgi:hypothetical protein